MAQTSSLPREVKIAVEQLGVDLTPTTPAAGIERFIAHRRGEVANSTLSRYEERLSRFEEYCDLHGVDNLNDLSGNEVDGFRLWRRDESSDRVDQLAPKTLRHDMLLFRSFLRYLEDIEVVRPQTAEKVQIPELPPGAGVRTYGFGTERAEAILQYLWKYEYGSTEHVVWLLLTKTGRRPGGLRSLDVEDVHLDTNEPYLSFRHREGTPLKKDEASEREVDIGPELATVLDDYLCSTRPEVTDEYDRSPLLASTQGRLSLSSLRRYAYKWSRPCMIGEDCPHGESPETCEAAQSTHDASKCDSSVPPYAARHGHITHLRREEMPLELISERCDVSESVLLRHYDESTEAEKRATRRKYMETFREESSNRGYF